MSTFDFPGPGNPADFAAADTGPLTGSLTALCGIAQLSQGRFSPLLFTATLNVHGPTGSLVTVQLFEAVSSTVIGQAQVTLGGNGASDDYRTITLQASLSNDVDGTSGPPASPNLDDFTTHYGVELLAQVSGGSATVIGGGISAVGGGARRAHI